MLPMVGCGDGLGVTDGVGDGVGEGFGEMLGAGAGAGATVSESSSSPVISSQVSHAGNRNKKVSAAQENFFILQNPTRFVR